MFTKIEPCLLSNSEHKAETIGGTFKPCKRVDNNCNVERSWNKAMKNVFLVKYMLKN